METPAQPSEEPSSHQDLLRRIRLAQAEAAQHVIFGGMLEDIRTAQIRAAEAAVVEDLEAMLLRLRPPPR